MIPFTVDLTLPRLASFGPGRAGIFVCMDAISANAFIQKGKWQKRTPAGDDTMKLIKGSKETIRLCVCPPLTHGSIKPALDHFRGFTNLIEAGFLFAE